MTFLQEAHQDCGEQRAHEAAYEAEDYGSVTCGHCKTRNVSVSHVRRCSKWGDV